MEIERKWRMTCAPDLPTLSHARVYQSYLSLTPEVRIRKYEDLLHGGTPRFDLTIKSEGTIAREEIIKSLTEEEYLILLSMTGECPPIIKDHRTYDWEGRTLEFSVVDADRKDAFTYAEIEFPTIEAAQAFRAPVWFGEETTERQTFRMKNYWRVSRLEDADG